MRELVMVPVRAERLEKRMGKSLSREKVREPVVLAVAVAVVPAAAREGVLVADLKILTLHLKVVTVA
jgi:hypothetical protein